MRRIWPDLTAAAFFVLAAVLVLRGLWADPGRRLLATNPQDQILFEWMLQHTAQAIAHARDPFLSPILGTPTAANLAGNTSVVLVGVLLAPVTRLVSPGASFTIFATAALAGTAIAWYAFLRRRLGTSVPAAFVGGLFCGFAPGIVSQANGHPHIAAQFLVPLLVALTLNLGVPGRWWSHPLRGAGLGLVAAAQILLGEETLFLAALGLGGFVVFYAVQRPAIVFARWKAALVSMVLAAVVTLSIVGYPLWVQFLGPDAYHGLPSGRYVADLGSFPAYAAASIAGSPAAAAEVAPNPSEQAAFFGVPLIVVAAVATVWLWRLVWVRSAALTAVLACVASLGVLPKWHGRAIGVPGSWTLVAQLPLFRDVVVVRLALIAIPVIGLLLAVSWDYAARLSVLRWAWPAMVLVALIPTLPRGLGAVVAKPAPAFISSGQWRSCAEQHGTLIAYGDTTRAGVIHYQMRLQLAAKLGYASPNGYYFSRDHDGEGRLGRPLRTMDVAVMTARETGRPPELTPRQLTVARADLVYWRAQCVVLQQGGPHADAMRDTITGIVQQPVQTGGGVWYWRIPQRTS
ncbi:hypothetical protein AB0H43_08315 [Hamadaea sp. NPDC050747]|uniref:hypothetical protein n=1 Tax=Hamadaea sp. NPDC050747 TaxID=3155789 RepID=UPI0033C6C0BD